MLRRNNLRIERRTIISAVLCAGVVRALPRPSEGQKILPRWKTPSASVILRDALRSEGNCRRPVKTLPGRNASQPTGSTREPAESPGFPCVKWSIVFAYPVAGLLWRHFPSWPAIVESTPSVGSAQRSRARWLFGARRGSRPPDGLAVDGSRCACGRRGRRATGKGRTTRHFQRDDPSRKPRRIRLTVSRSHSHAGRRRFAVCTYDNID